MSDELGNPIKQIEAYRSLFRVQRDISPAAFKVLGYIVDRSIGWSTPSVALSYADFLEGDFAYPPIGMSDRTLRNALTELVDGGFVSVASRDSRKRKAVYTPLVLEKDIMTSLRPSKKRKPQSGKNYHTGMVETTTDGVVGITTYKRTNKNHRKGPPNSAPSGPAATGSIDDLLPEAMDRSKKRQASKASAARSKKTVASLWTTWSAAWANAYADEPGFTAPMAWSKIERGSMANVARKFTGTTEELHTLIEFVVSRWGYCMREGFATWKQAPSHPAPQVLVKFLPKFVAIQSSYLVEQRDKRAAMTDWEAAMFDRLVKEGSTHEAAQEAVAEERGRRSVAKTAPAKVKEGGVAKTPTIPSRGQRVEVRKGPLMETDEELNFDSGDLPEWGE
jgi:hypothetical protein